MALPIRAVFTALLVLWAAPLRAGEIASRPPIERVQTTAPCTCRAFGRDYGMGETVCLRLDGKPALAECAMFLNNTSWRSTGRPCPEG
jgi:hypothetical protein